MSTAYYSDREQRRVARVVVDIIRARELLFDLVSKELRIRYRVAAMGFFWAVLHPLMMVAVLSLVFGVLFDRAQAFGLDADTPPFPVFLLCGLIPWQYFSSAISTATHSLVENKNLVKKVYFPREVIPIASVLDWLVNAGIGFVMLLGAHLLFGGRIGLGVLWMPLVFGIEVAFVLGVALLFSSVNVFYRDVGYVVEVSVLFGFYATPVFYELAMVQGRLAEAHPWLYRLYMLNPMAGLVPAFRQALFENRMPDLALLAWPIVAACLALVAGTVVFRRSACTFADHL